MDLQKASTTELVAEIERRLEYAARIKDSLHQSLSQFIDGSGPEAKTDGRRGKASSGGKNPVSSAAKTLYHALDNKEPRTKIEEKFSAYKKAVAVQVAKGKKSAAENGKLWKRAEKFLGHGSSKRPKAKATAPAAEHTTA